MIISKDKIKDKVLKNFDGSVVAKRARFLKHNRALINSRIARAVQMPAYTLESGCLHITFQREGSALDDADWRPMTADSFYEEEIRQLMKEIEEAGYEVSRNRMFQLLSNGHEPSQGLIIRIIDEKEWDQLLEWRG